MIADAIVAIPGATPLPKLLTAVHQNRLGHVARVLSASRASLAAQLTRAGVPTDDAPDLDGVERVILVFAAALSERGSRLLLDRGAERCWVVTRAGQWREVSPTPAVPATQPQLHLPIASSEGTAAQG
jgi:hypothetical protein